MRDYAKVAPQFWIGPTGKAIRKKGPVAQVVAMYLMSSPHANMIGMYHLPVAYLSADTGIPYQGAFKALIELQEVGFCGYDVSAEVVWVYEMAKFQVGDQLKPGDKQCAGVENTYIGVPKNRFLPDFFDKYQPAFNMQNKREYEGPIEHPCEGACEGLRSQEQEQEKEQEQINTPQTPRKRGAAERGIQFKTFIADCKAKGEKAISDYRPVFDWADAVGLQLEFVQLAWFEFGRQFGEGGVKEANKQKDWRKTFRNYVEKNYLKLWYSTADGKHELTTLGHQAQKANAERLAA